MTKNIAGIKELVIGCQQNSIGFKELMYKSFYGYVTGVILRYISNEQDLQELVNDSFIKIFKHINSFESAALTDDTYLKTFKGWLGKIASRTAIDHLRKEKKKFPTDDLEKNYNQLSSTFISHKMEVQEMMKLLNKLPEIHKLIFNLYEVEGFSHDEIAKMLRIPSSTSRVFLGRAKNKLRELYTTTFKEVTKK
ncbi:MAG: RNA polymerase sigma factor [Arachidicoccus sp.]|nr:RNA polymerase sigma factor [Arachidicoccus sp.]